MELIDFGWGFCVGLIAGILLMFFIIIKLIKSEGEEVVEVIKKMEEEPARERPLPATKTGIKKVPRKNLT